jgi:hypothetical protein
LYDIRGLLERWQYVVFVRYSRAQPTPKMGREELERHEKIIEATKIRQDICFTQESRTRNAENDEPLCMRGAALGYDKFRIWNLPPENNIYETIIGRDTMLDGAPIPIATMQDMFYHGVYDRYDPSFEKTDAGASPLGDGDLVTRHLWDALGFT